MTGNRERPSTASQLRSQALFDRLRAPREMTRFYQCIALNLVVLAAGITIVLGAPTLLQAFPVLAELAKEMRSLVVVVVLSLPLASFLRHVHLEAHRGNGVLISPAQFPAMYELYMEVCQRLEIDDPPDLYLAFQEDNLSKAYATFWRRPCVVVSAEILEYWDDSRDIVAFAMGSALGSLYLGHKRWWVETLTWYVLRIPILRRPILDAFTYSCDRCGAYVAPTALRALIFAGSGPHVVSHLRLDLFAEQARAYGGLWSQLSSVGEVRPHVCVRAKRLLAADVVDVVTGPNRAPERRDRPLVATSSRWPARHGHHARRAAGAGLKRAA